ncbi:peptidase family C78-domain-containing protein, partial [Mycena floridula]
MDSEDPTSVICQFCDKCLDQLPLHQRQEHYDRHLSSPKSTSNAIAGPSKSPPKKKVWTKKLEEKLTGSGPEQDTFWYPSLASISPPSNFTPGLILILKKYLSTSHSQGKTIRAVLCYDRTVHVGKHIWDSVWGCGYRNFLMSCTALMDQQFQPDYFALLDHPIQPGVRNLQRWIEDAWKAGFDLEGAQELKKLVGTSKWIGTSDLYTAFVYRGIPARLVEFVDLKKKITGVKPLIDWIVRYFATPAVSHVNGLVGASPVVVTDHMPLILQHQGHSRLVVGYEIVKNGNINLLVFESTPISKALRSNAISAFEAQSKTPLGPAMPNVPLKRRASSSTATPGSSKRSKSTSNIAGPSDASWEALDEVCLVDDDDENEIVFLGENKKEKTSPKKKPFGNLSFLDVLKPFRLESKKLIHDKYQLLYWTMEAPLSDNDRRKMRVVTSE